MNTNTLVMNNRGDKSMLIKRWDRVNGNGNGDESKQFLPIEYKTMPTGRGKCFSIGDSWVERMGKKVHSYKVIALEDVIIPAGAFKCYKVIEDADNGAKNCYWFAPEIGLVKWEIGEIKGVLQDCVKDNEV